MQSLHGFCKENDLPKSSVRRWLNAQGFDTSEGLSDAAVKAAKAEFLGTPEQASAENAHTALVTIESGNHRTALDTPEISLSVDLARFRDIESVSFDDPLALAEQFLEAADLVEAGMQADIDRQRKQLEATEQARKQIESKAQELNIKRHLYSDRINDLASRQTVSTADLQQALKDLNSLGKPSAG